MNELLTILLQENAEGGSQWGGMIMIIAMIVIFYFFMIRPQSKKQKELKKAREAMKKGDKVISAGGIHGRIREIHDSWIMMEIAPNVAIKIGKESVFAAPNSDAKTEPVKGQKGKKSEDADAGADLEQAAGKVTD